jgi:neutral trehalase
MQRLFAAYEGHSMREQPLLDVFLFEDVMVNAIYADALRAVAGVTRAIGEPGADVLDARRERCVRALMAKCWDERAGAFWDLSGKEEERVKILTFSVLFPLILRELDERVARKLVKEHLLNEREFWLPYPVPSIAASDPSFDPGWKTDTTWRGPTWLNVNWYLYWGLRQHGFDDVARELAQRSIALVATSGVREFFDPITGEGEGARDFGWTTLVLDLIAAERARA